MTITLRISVPVEELSLPKNSTGNDTASSHQPPARGIDTSTGFSRLLSGPTAGPPLCKRTQLQNFNCANLCNSLVRDERVCCSSGTLPSTLPSGNSDGTCKTRQVVLGDDCGSLANKCANSKTGLCSSLAEGQHVCCIRGTLPDLRPKEDADGYCAVYTTKENDYCSKIAAGLMLTVEELETFDKNAWGWNGCKLLYPKFNMCVSKGAAPMLQLFL
ncbi:killer toxin subunits alpha/beta [Colletotrichum spaethianum]|uniref:Killer toxin subunits alpha/beta n=1 Tax=Colletotrichum spaethianum TaxID=700344 RepID=A0AA37L346_9PEZI|nr:killer toxin subunits alpha/beta [Colletotrichum spaethianum]GKT41012.1 killer toxin subunits alpha/beta [Colletotrichum spaethianum]